jgi:putative Mg2+ transporter-C (MgtC) family protein
MDAMLWTGELTEVFFRLGAAVLIGGTLGINRELRHKPAGLRTHALVSLGAALITLTAVQLATSGGTVDGSVVVRAIQGVITGIGFLGAGVILRSQDPKDQKMVSGLTTSASIWMVAALGIACGVGFWQMALVAMVLSLLILVLGKPLEKALHHILAGRDEDELETPVDTKEKSLPRL